MIKLPFAQKCCGLLGGNVFKQHTAVADGQDNVVAHIRTAGFADQNRTVVFAVQTQYAPQPERFVTSDAAQFDMFGQIGRAAVERIAIRTAEYGGFQSKPEHPLRSPAALVGRTEGNDASGNFFGMGGGKVAQYQPAQTVSGKMQRLARIVFFNKFHQCLRVLRHGVLDAVITEQGNVKALLCQHIR